MIAFFDPVVKLFGAACQAGGSFFGFPTWYQYLDGEQLASGKCGPVIRDYGDFALIGLAVVDIALRIAGFMAVVFVVYGGLKLILAQGDPEKIKGGRSTVLNALVGLVIAIAASAIVTFIATKF